MSQTRLGAQYLLLEARVEDDCGFKILHLGWGEEQPHGKRSGVWVHGKWNRSQQCPLAVKRANCILVCIKYSIVSWLKGVIVPLCIGATLP